MSQLITPKGHYLGCKPDLPDQRDFVFAVAKIAAVPAVLPPNADLRASCPPIYEQGALGSCTANALGADFDIVRFGEGLPFMTPSRLFIYYNERVLEDTVSIDAGANLRDGIKVVAGQGVPQETIWPYDISQFAVKPSDAVYTAAESNQALVYERITPATLGDTTDMRSALAAGLPFVSGIVVYQSFESQQTVETGVVPLPAAGETMLGGHAVAVVGYDDAKQWFICRNSWGDSWGDRGHCYLPYSYLTNSQLAFDAWVIRTVELPPAPTPPTPTPPTPSPTPNPAPNPTPSPAPAPSSFWSQIANFFKRLFGLK